MAGGAERGRPAIADEADRLIDLAAELGLGRVKPRLVKAAHHSSFALAPQPIFARVQSAIGVEVAVARARLELSLARWLAAADAPAIAPLDDRLAGPHVRGSSVVTLWPLLTGVRAATEDDAVAAGESLARLHAALADYPGELPDYREALDYTESLLEDRGAMPALPPRDRDLLATEFARLCEAIDRHPQQLVPLHGDPHLGNLLIHAGRPYWIDLEDACRGPREYDVACLPRAAWRAFPELDRPLLLSFARLRSVSVAAWCWADPDRSPEASEAAVYHLELTRRHARWRANAQTARLPSPKPSA